MSDIRVRPQEPRDDVALRRLAAEAMPPQVAEAGGCLDAPRTEQVLSADIVFVADVEGHQAGYVALSEQGDALVVEQLVVATSDVGRHVGHHLLDWAEGYGVSRNLRRVRIPVEGDNRRAHEFYGRRGYLPASGALERELVHM